VIQQCVKRVEYPPGDVAFLARSIERLIESKVLRQTLAENATLALNMLINFDSMVGAYAEVFREAWLSGGTRAAS